MKAISHLNKVTVRKCPIRVKIGDFFVLCDLEIWRKMLKNNRALLLCYFKLCASFCSHWWIQTVVAVRKRLSWVMTSVTLTFDIWPWPFAWTPFLSLVITRENFVIIRWQEHSEKCVTNRQTDRRTDKKRCSSSFLVRAKKSKHDTRHNYTYNFTHWNKNIILMIYQSVAI